MAPAQLRVSSSAEQQVIPPGGSVVFCTISKEASTSQIPPGGSVVFCVIA
ncbi:uncharacterized protein L969DRAFT_48704 [Mixia osmundae IAM 14324]|uniref:Uncharacterized protein n=1 Tax=Mixia osmundae (strain CBS 9802 / IAM 14324 / JCM 22182 / KY 12970) TaxID=764103 RepID=G7DVT6_MIXOS|nr:uncharacterized protein L969DRAFT_48704 [Mixia osmundae IAM 14324]KEI39623.1 hypothetical protein L969DRAFT_48704 [Mixia osmundae IAM 14324]GAA94696.1 hypothetical protein E5Q_01349 [Mixia osmundae IAM 14324]